MSANIAEFQTRLLKARADIAALEERKQRLREEYGRLKEQKHDAMSRYQQEIYELDKREAEENTRAEQAISALKESVQIERAALIRPISLCSVKDALSKDAGRDEGLRGFPEDAKVIYENGFLVLYERLQPNNRPVNKISYQICLSWKCRGEIRYVLQELEKKLDLHSWSREDAVFYDRDFKTEGDAWDHSARNRQRATADYIAAIQKLEKEIDTASTDMNAVFDFRMLLDPAITTVSRNHAGDTEYAVKDATKHTLTIEREHLPITITQDGHQFSIQGDRHQDDAEQILGLIRHRFQLVKEEEQ